MYRTDEIPEQVEQVLKTPAFDTLVKEYLKAFPSPLMHVTHAVMAQRGDLIANNYGRTKRFDGTAVEQGCLYGTIYGSRFGYSARPDDPVIYAAAADADDNWTALVGEVRVAIAHDEHHFDERDERYEVEGAIARVLLPKLHERVGVTL